MPVSDEPNRPIRPGDGVRRVLVVVASKHGATAEIAEALARAITDGSATNSTATNSTATNGGVGVSAVAVPAQQQPDPTAFDAVVLGSAVYAGRWLDPARQYAARFADALRARPVWLFSSGPIGDPPFPPDEPHDTAAVTALTGAREHRVFPGRLDKARLSFGERAVVTAMRAPVGDFRDWAEITAWARSIAAAVTAPAPAGHG